ncbi:MAG: hypothetical protein AB1453_02570 [Chloroflexota bacterium]|jgi:hypothetical protein
MKKWIALASIAIFALALGYLLTKISRSSSMDGTRSSLGSAEDSSIISMAPTPVSAPALWASSASTIAELVAEADLVIRARVIQDPEPRVVSFHGPIVAEDGTVIGEGVDKVIFSDTEVEVVEIYKGSTRTIITVMQTGGIVGDTGQRFSLGGDPLYLKNEEVILFLVDISDDPIHAQGRTLYRIVNPAGRYTIKGVEVLNHGEFSPSAALPKTVDELVRQIKEAVTQNAAESR